MGFPHMIILRERLRTVHCYEVTNQYIPNVFATYIIITTLCKTIKQFIRRGLVSRWKCRGVTEIFSLINVPSCHYLHEDFSLLSAVV